ncbi:MAG: hypothetical protein LUB59_02690 [Candidatus Gastranaerophilales bacterium]|nr:hypothetical protein [Candidatus Gastranaerophilales bacterium]
MENLKKIFNTLLDFIYKKRCYFCNSNKECTKMCSQCYSELNFSDYNPNRTIHGVDIFTAGIYEKKLQKMIRGVKYHKQKDLAFFQAKFMWEYFMNISDKNNLPDKLQVIPTPLYKTREQKRGYNHMKLVAEEFCRLSGYILNNKLIKRIKETKPQYKLSRQERMKNLKNAFQVNKSELLDMPVLLLDDICTTGSTFESMIDELHENSINDIICLAAATP